MATAAQGLYDRTARYPRYSQARAVTFAEAVRLPIGATIPAGPAGCVCADSPTNA
jgi:hypothetical protein